MNRASRSIASVLATCAIALVGAGVAAADPGQTALPGTSEPALAGATDLGPTAASQSLSLQIWLTPDEAGATQFAGEVSQPGSILYHQYLSPDQYTAQFGPTVDEAQAVSAWLTGQGFTGVATSAQRDYVSATGSAATVNNAFDVQMTNYSVIGADGKPETVTANAQDLSLPSSLTGDVLSVTGLNNTLPTTEHTATTASAQAPRPFCSRYWAQYSKAIVPTFHGITQASVGVCGYSADQLRDAYGQTSANTGTGQTVALIEVGVPTAMFQTLTDYAKSNGLPAPASTQFREEIIGQGNDCGNEFDVEEQLDSESLYAMAPGANQLMVDGDSCNFHLEGVQALFDADLAVIAGNGSSPSASITSNSWDISGGESLPRVYADTAHAINLRATAEGVGMYFASQDSPGIAVPSSDPYSLAVGGTTLGIGPSGNYEFETGWSNQDGLKVNGVWRGIGIPRDAAGGGVSTIYPQPNYQAGVVPASLATYQGQLDRAVPDISADADANSGILQGDIELKQDGQPGAYHTFFDGGTSLATPLVAGMVADAQQGQPASFGFVNPLIYSLYRSPALRDPLPITASSPENEQAAWQSAQTGIFGATEVSVIDSQVPAYTSQVTLPGYDTMTGVGTPNGTFFINALRSGG